MSWVRMFRFRLFAVLVAMVLSPKAALAEIDLGRWQTHATMAEQGAVCGAFADLMAMQSLIDEKVGRLWSERRAYSGSVIKRAAELEGRNDVDNEAIDALRNRYSMWLLNNLANPANAEILDPMARDAASDMIGDVCAGLYAQADRAILKKHPTLGACSNGEAPLPALSSATEAPAACESESAIIAATTIKQAEDTVAEMLRRLQQSQTREDDLANDLAILQIDNDRLLREIDANRIVTSKVNDLTSENNQLRGEISGLKQELATRLDTQRLLARDMQNLQTRHEETLARVDSLTDELAAARTAIIAAPTNEDMAEKMVELATARATLRDITAERDSLSEELTLATTTLETMTGTNALSSDAPPTARASNGAPNALALLDTDMTAKSPKPAARPETKVPATSLTTALQAVQPEARKSFVAQLGAFSSRTGALSEINRIQTNFPGKHALAALTITPLQRDDGSSIFRITTGEMLAEDAQRLCGELWDSMVSCMLRTAP